MTDAAPFALARNSDPSDPGNPSDSAAAGSLAPRLVASALEILADEGLGGLSLRKVARRAGVSHAAPARHYRSLADLLAEVAAEGFEMLSAAIVEANADLPSDASAAERLKRAGHAYCRCATGNPALFSLMFRDAELDLSNPRYARSSAAAFEHLLVHVRAAQDEGWQAGRETRELAGAAWAVIHGLATLWALGAMSRAISGVSLDEQVRTTFEVWMNEAPAAASPRPSFEVHCDREDAIDYNRVEERVDETGVDT